MRIVGGSLGGRVIKAPNTANVRPSTEKTRGAIFSVLGGDIDNALVADLFCGSGALGIEALSRGASYAVFVDLARQAISTVKQNIFKLGLEDRSNVLSSDVLNIKAADFKDISIVFADPPYKKGFAERLITLLCLKKIAADGILVIEHESGWSYPDSELRELRKLTFGDSAVSFFRLPGESE